MVTAFFWSWQRTQSNLCLCLQQTHISHAPSKIYVKQSVVSCAAAADIVFDVLQLVVGLFQYLEGAQQREPAFDLSTPATEMVTPFVDVAECRELGNVEPASLTPSTRLPVSR